MWACRSEATRRRGGCSRAAIVSAVLPRNWETHQAVSRPTGERRVERETKGVSRSLAGPGERALSAMGRQQRLLGGLGTTAAKASRHQLIMAAFWRAKVSNVHLTRLVIVPRASRSQEEISEASAVLTKPTMTCSSPWGASRGCSFCRRKIKQIILFPQDWNYSRLICLISREKIQNQLFFPLLKIRLLYL